jgi:hypothetical protein
MGLLGGGDGGQVGVTGDDDAGAAFEQEASALAGRGGYSVHLEHPATGDEALREDVPGQQFTGPQAAECGMHG